MKLSAHKGFTLIEVLVAMAVTALIGALSWQFVTVAVDATDDAGAALASLQAVESTWSILAMDLQQAVDTVATTQEVRSELQRPEFRGVSNPLAAEPFLHLLRDGWTNLQGLPRSELQRVAYRLEADSLWRESWPQRNLPDVLQAEPMRRLLLDGVTAVDVRFLPAAANSIEDGWLPLWPEEFFGMPRQNPTPIAGASPGEPGEPGEGSGEILLQRSLPLAVAVTLNLEKFGEIERLFIIPGL
ncbi:MAG: type II secretion system minor pseudopilin GspJ [Pseudohongiellaceae bacterium]